MNIEQPQLPQEEIERTIIEEEKINEITQEQVESILGKSLKCFKKWAGLGTTVISIYVGGEVLIDSSEKTNQYDEHIVNVFKPEDLIKKEQNNEKIEISFGKDAVSHIYFGDRKAFFEKQEKERKEPKIKGFEEKGWSNIVKYGLTEKYLLYPRGWINGEVGAFEFMDKFDGEKAGIFNTGTGNILVYKNTPRETHSLYSTLIQPGIIEHELGHANDWETDMDLNILERQELLLSVLDRVNSTDSYRRSVDDYASTFDDGTQEGLYKNAKEYWAEICSEYFSKPEQFAREHPVDFELVNKYVVKNDPTFDIFSKDRGAFDTQTGNIKEIWIGK